MTRLSMIFRRSFGAISLATLSLVLHSCACAPDTTPEPNPPVSTDTPDAGTPVVVPDGGTVTMLAPPLPPHDNVSFVDLTEFLYTGPNAVQTGVAPGVIVKARVSVLRGQVFDASKKPLPGVKVTVLGHPEYGATLSRSDGAYDMAVNGGESLVVDFTKAGLLPSQRRVSTQWNGFFRLDDVVLVPLDEVVTSVTFGSDKAQLASGSAQQDASGQRTARVYFGAGVNAKLTLPGGATQALGKGSFRATEYTVGDTGPLRMPGALPPFSGYTYAVELSLDEAITAGATSVEFSQPVSLYVDNFLKFPWAKPCRWVSTTGKKAGGSPRRMGAW